MRFSGSDSDTIGQLLGWFGAAGAWLLFLSPVQTMILIWRKRDVQQFSEVPYIVSMANCLLWILYSVVTPGRLQPLVTNIGGLCLQMVYCFIFVRCSRGTVGKKIRTRLLATVMGLAVIGCFVFVSMDFIYIPDFLGVGSDDRTTRENAKTDVLGIFATVFNAGMYASPLAIMGQVIKSNSVEFMPLSMTVACFMCSMIWAAYALYVGDYFIGIPNWIGIVFGVAQICLYINYGGCGKITEDNKPPWWVNDREKEKGAVSTRSDHPYCALPETF